MIPVNRNVQAHRRADGRIRMVALRMSADPGDATAVEAPPWPDPADWLPLQQAACELGISPATLRRMIRKGLVRNRIVPRRGGFRYLVYLPNSRHAQMRASPEAAPATPPRRHLRLVEDAPAGPWRSDLADADDDACVRRMQARLEHLSHTLSNTLRMRQAVPPGSALPAAGAARDEPYARYRWLAKRGRRWWRIP